MGTGFHRAAARSRSGPGVRPPATAARMSRGWGPRTEKIAKHATVTAAAAISPIDRFRTDFCTEPSSILPQPSGEVDLPTERSMIPCYPIWFQHFRLQLRRKGCVRYSVADFAGPFSGWQRQAESSELADGFSAFAKTIGKTSMGPPNAIHRVWGPLAAATRSRMKTVSHAWRSAVCILPMIAATVFRPHPPEAPLGDIDRPTCPCRSCPESHPERCWAARRSGRRDRLSGGPHASERSQDHRSDRTSHPCTRSPR